MIYPIDKQIILVVVSGFFLNPTLYIQVIIELMTLVSTKILGEKFSIITQKINLTIVPEKKAKNNNSLLSAESNMFIKSDKLE